MRSDLCSEDIEFILSEEARVIQVGDVLGGGIIRSIRRVK